MMQHDDEPVRGLPARLPAGETILWQGAPDWRVLARSAFHLRLIAIYFGLLAAAGLLTGRFTGAAVTMAAGIACVGVLALLAWAIARSTVYTLTNRRIVIRAGVALPKCVNLPLQMVGAGDLRPLGRGHGDVALTMTDEAALSYFLLWPHARPWKLRSPRPMLRALPDAETVALRIAQAVGALTPVERHAPAAAVSPPHAATPAGAATA